MCFDGYIWIGGLINPQCACAVLWVLWFDSDVGSGAQPKWNLEYLHVGICGIYGLIKWVIFVKSYSCGHCAFRRFGT